MIFFFFFSFFSFFLILSSFVTVELDVFLFDRYPGAMVSRIEKT